jgi:haloacetate dehalogenase
MCRRRHRTNWSPKCCGHYVPEEAPDELVAEMLSFFEAVEP